MPWNLTLRDRACLGDRAHAYALAEIVMEEGSTAAQESYLCAGTHDFNDPVLPLQTASIRIGAHAFVGLRAIVLPGITIGRGAVVGAGSIVTHNVAPLVIVAGNPAAKIGDRPASALPAGPTDASG
jgi:putative colanic acid biosynthesis acetyltransferase WcaF